MSINDELSVHHHASHRNLLTPERAECAPHSHLDAVIVPASRPVESLHTAIELAGRLGCVLLALCSKRVLAHQVLASARKQNVSVVALDIDSVDSLPQFKTSAAIEGSDFARPTDQSHKRNLGLSLARVAGWRRVMFLDDDIEGLHVSDVRAAAGLLYRYDVVCLENRGFADNSVVCRIGRELGQRQDEFIGAGALIVAPRRMRTFFPDIYNEDWFFLLGARRLAVTGSMWHRAHDDPFDATRARQEELGDHLGEGLYWALDNGQPPVHMDGAHWNDFLGHRRQYIDQLDTINDRDFQRRDVTPALEAASKVCDGIAEQPELYGDYLELWRSDLITWQYFISERRTGLGLVKALAELGWYGVAQVHLLPWHEEDRLILPNGWKRAADQQADRPSDRARQSPPLAQAATFNGAVG